MSTLDKRVVNLEKAMVQLINVVSTTRTQTAQSLLELKNEMSDFKNEMSDFKNEMSDFKNEMSDFKNEMSDFKNEAENDRKKLFKKLAENSDRMGTFLEDFVAPNIPMIAKEYFGITKLEYSGLRIFKVNTKDNSFCKEFDTVAAGDGKFIINETKCTPRNDYINRFKDGLKDVFDYFPEFEGYEIIPIFSTLYFQENTIKYLTKRHIYALGLKGDLMGIMNPNLKK